MNTDIRLSIGFFSHPKIKKLRRKLGAEGLLALQTLWLWAAQNRPDGVLSSMGKDDIELAADWPEEEGAFLAALVELRLLDAEADSYRLHNWEERNPWQSEAGNRSDASRLARMAKTHPVEYKALEQAGIKGISREVYDVITASNDRLTTVERLLTNPLSPFLSLPCLSSPSPSQPEEERETSLRSVSLSGTVVPDEQNEIPTDAHQPDFPVKKLARSKPEPLPEGSEAYRLAVLMRDTLKANVPTLKEPDLQNWAQAFDVALRNDERMKDARFVAEVIRWACSDNFWRANIQSPGKLREKFDQLTAKMEAEAAKSRASPVQAAWKSPAQRRLEANQAAGQEAKRLLFGQQATQEVTYDARRL